MSPFKILHSLWPTTLLLLSTFFLPVVSSRLLSQPPETALAPPPPPPTLPERFSSFNPSIAVILGVLTTLFSLTFLLFMYTKHCKGSPPPFRGGRTVSGGGYYYHSRGLPVSGRKNSGINPVVIESLPVFRFRSLRGAQKDGLECAVCLNRFEPDEVLRLLPKCKHAFHVECVDTWLDAHSTCPLCRFRVDPEDVLLVDRSTQTGFEPEEAPPSTESTRRVSGRHSSAGERGQGRGVQTTSSRRSCDASLNDNGNISISAVHRKDGLLITAVDKERAAEQRIRISTDPAGPHQRWSDVQPWDLFYLRSRIQMNQGRRSSSSKGEKVQVQGKQRKVEVQGSGIEGGDGRMVINERSMSEITGLSRLAEPVERGMRSNEERERQRSRVVSRWMAWISQSGPAGRSGI